MPECAPPRVAAAIARTGGDLSLTTGPQIPGAGVGAAFLCIDDLDPELSWRVSGPVGTVQRAYQIRAASSIGALSRADRWDSGKVSSATSYGIAYAGRRPQSRERIYWQVRAWDTRGADSGWSSPAYFETGLLTAADWSARWIGNRDWLNDRVHPATVNLPAAQDARYVRVTVTDIADTTVKPEDAKPGDWRVELAEIGVLDSTAPGTNLALGAEVTTSGSDDTAGQWAPQYLTDRLLTTDAAPYGYRSAGRPQGTSWDGDEIPVEITLDLGQVRRLDRLQLYPRADVVSPFGDTANFPKNLNISSSVDGSTFTSAVKIKKLLPPSTLHTQPAALPVFAKQFGVGTEVRSARLYITGLGMYDATINGKAVSDAVLEPPNTDYTKQVVYSTYDVTKLLRSGGNAVGVQLGNGIYSVYDVPGAPHYQKLAGSYGPLGLIAQLEIRYADGRTQTIGTDGSWRSALGGTTFTNWFGGEEYDARRLPPGWDVPGADLSGWRAAVPTPKPVPTARLVARSDPPVEPVDAVGSFSSSDPLLNGIHRIIDRAIQSNMYSVPTDCPTREKLGWLEQVSLVHGSVSRAYDVAAYYRKFQTYGDLTLLRKHYPAMQRYLDFLTGKSSGYLLDRGDFGDWIAIDNSTPRGILQTYAYHRVAETLGRIATVLGNAADVALCAGLTGHIADAFNAKFLNVAEGTYGSGSQAGDALALDLGVVPADQWQRVLDHLIASIRAQGNHLTVGEIACRRCSTCCPRPIATTWSTTWPRRPRHQAMDTRMRRT